MPPDIGGTDILIAAEKNGDAAASSLDLSKVDKEHRDPFNRLLLAQQRLRTTPS